MPGPVDSPSLSAIEAVINPSSTKYMYFVADVTTGNVYFAESYEEHQHNVETYINSKLKDKQSDWLIKIKQTNSDSNDTANGSKNRKEKKMAEKTYVMTQAEKEQLEAELEEYKLVRRPEVVERIKIARSYGDLSENSEYEAAKDEQAFVEGQIQILETKIRYAEIVDSDAVANDEVAIGKTVVVQEVGTNDKDTYHIVGAAGADIFS